MFSCITMRMHYMALLSTSTYFLNLHDLGKRYFCKGTAREGGEVEESTNEFWKTLDFSLEISALT